MNLHIKQGKLDLIIGNMFSGKSTELIRRINNLSSINKKIIVINYLYDNRYSSDSVSTHTSISVKCLKVEKLCSIKGEILNNCDYIFIDEGQFFSDLYDFVTYYTDVVNKHIIISGLDGDSNRKKFGQMLDLIPICDSVMKLQAYCINCSDGTYGPFTKKINSLDSLDNTNTNTNSPIDIGGKEKYIPVCRYHYLLN